MYNSVQEKGVKTIEKSFDGFLTIDQIASMLHVHRRTVWRWIRAGKLKAAKIGKAWRIREEDFEAFVRKAFGEQDPDEQK